MGPDGPKKWVFELWEPEKWGPKGLGPARRPRSRRGFTQQPENSERAHLSVLATKKSNKIPRKDSQREKKERKWGRETEKEARNFGPPTHRGSTLLGPTLLGSTLLVLRSTFSGLGPQPERLPPFVAHFSGPITLDPITSGSHFFLGLAPHRPKLDWPKLDWPKLVKTGLTKVGLFLEDTHQKFCRPPQHTPHTTHTHTQHTQNTHMAKTLKHQFWPNAVWPNADMTVVLFFFNFRDRKYFLLLFGTCKFFFFIM